MAASHTNILPPPTSMTENPDGENKFFCFGVSQKSASVVQLKIVLVFFSAEAFEKCSHLRDKGGVLTLISQYWVCADPYSKAAKFGRPFGFAFLVETSSRNC